MKLEPQIEQLYAALNAQLDNFQLGERFYSIRTLQEKYKVNRRVIDGALERLEANRCIRRENKVGIFSNVNRRPVSRKLLFLAPDWPSELINIWFRLISDYAARDEQYRIAKIFLDPNGDEIPQFDFQQIDAVIAIRAAKSLNTPDLLFWAALPIPVVFINSLFGDLEFSTVCGDNTHGGMLAADHLLRHGHRELAVVISESTEVTGVRMRTAGFQQYAEMHHARVRVIHCNTHNGESSNQHAYDGMRNYLERYGCDFTGVFVVADASVPGVLTALNEHHVQVPADVSVIGYDGLEGGNFYHPPLTTVGTDFNGLIKLLFDGLELCFSGKQKFFHGSLPMQLIERASVQDNKRSNPQQKEEKP